MALLLRIEKKTFEKSSVTLKTSIVLLRRSKRTQLLLVAEHEKELQVGIQSVLPSIRMQFCQSMVYRK